AYPDRLPDRERIDAFEALGAAASAAVARLDFLRPDPQRFPCLELAYQALRRGGTAPAVLSAANEIAVAAFVEGTLGFAGVADVVRAVLERTPPEPLSLDTVRAADVRARAQARDAVEARSAAPANS
ncbi:MAG: 1-deoxy-D-xylulose-5-phosphate reductoisomerase, partial [Candidatus Eremiobacteraeota bacterium]|nr:1-deoxy-D-xylulose-5-phosphate reductoisomerase [Candidatus Eremiobacteraeota bacterium]